MSKDQHDQDFPTINIDMDEHRPIERKSADGLATKEDDSLAKGSPAKGGSKLAMFASVIALFACGGAAYLYTELDASQKEAALVETRLLSLEDKLSATGEEMGNSTVALQVKVTELTNKSNELWEQMDKLWASAWRRNQQDIKSLDGQVTKIKTDTQTLLAQVDKKAQTAESNTQQLVARVDGLNGKLNLQANDILTASVSAEQAVETARAQSSNIDALNEKIQLLEKRNSSLLNKINDLEVQLREIATKTVSNQHITQPNVDKRSGVSE